MARYILIDLWSGYIFGDTADINGEVVPCDNIIDAARALDASIGEHDRVYAAGNRSHMHNGCSGYAVYRADIDGSEAIPVVHDGQDAETIRSVETLCQFEGVVLVSDRDGSTD